MIYIYIEIVTIPKHLGSEISTGLGPAVAI